jgi:transposase
VAELQKELAAVKAENLELRARLAQNSQNSSKPPSSDLPGTKPQPKKGRRGKKRRRGGQLGHKAHACPVPDHVDKVNQYRAAECHFCQADLMKHGRLTGGVVNHYVYALPDIRPIVTDEQCLDTQCQKCGRVTRATLPPGVARGSYDPSVQATAAFVRGELKQSVRQVSAVMTNLMHVPMSPAMVTKVQHQVSQILAAPFDEALAYVQARGALNADETSWREDKQRAWLWVAVSVLVTVFLIHPSRGAAAAKALLGAAFRGFLTTDRWSAYNWVPPERRQVCWSHLQRDFKSFLDYGPEAKRLGERLLRERRKMFRRWHRVRDGTLGRAEFQRGMLPVRRQILALLEEGTRLSSPKVSGMCKAILRLRGALFTFVDAENLEPTNNAAERAIRFAVLWRKGCFGSDSARGSRFVERFLTVRATLRSQRRDLYTYLKDACTAALHGTPVPSLLPAAAPTTANFALAA